MSQWPAYNPEPPIDLDGLRDEAISARWDEIWNDADLLFGAFHDAGLPFDFKTAVLICDQRRRLNKQPRSRDDDVDKCIRAICACLCDAVTEAATWSVDNPCIDFD